MSEPTWAIVRTRSRCEDIVAQGFLNAGYRAYVPRGRVLLQPHGAQRKPIATMRAVFSGLVFVQDWRGWPKDRIGQVIGLMPGMRSGSHAILSAADIAILMAQECRGGYEIQAPRPPANGIVMPDTMSVGDVVEYDFAGTMIEAALTALSPAGRATIRGAIFGRETNIEVDASELRAVSA